MAETEQTSLSRETEITPRHSIVVVREPQEQCKEINVGSAERVISAVGGSTLILHAIKHPSLFNLLLGVGGGMLVRRGVFGHCDLYDAMGINGNTPRPGQQNPA